MGQNQWTKRGQELSLAGIKYWRADWLTAIRYVAGDGVHSLSTGKAYICILEHNSDSAKEPGVGANWHTYWDVLVDGANQIEVEQTAHGFTGGEYVKSSGVAGEYDLAQADTEPHASGIGFVTEVDGVDNFTITQSGYLKAPTIVPAQTAGTVMYLDPATPGAITATKPTTPGEYVKPVAIIIESAVSMWILSDSPRIVAGTGGGSVESVTSSDDIIDVDNTDPDNPILSLDFIELANTIDFINELTNNTDFQTAVNTFVSGGGGEVVKKTITQIGHGLSDSVAVKSSGTDGEFDLALADDPANADSVGIIIDVPDVDTFVLAVEGFAIIPTLPGGAVAGDNLFLSDSVAGELTLTDPAIANVPGTVSFPLGTVIDASLGLCNIHKYRPQEQQSTPLGSSSIPAQDFPYYSGTTTQTASTFKFTSNIDGTIGVGFYQGTSGTETIIRFEKETASGQWFITHTTTLVGGVSVQNPKFAITNTYIYFMYADNNINQMRRYDIADLANVTSITIAGTGWGNGGNSAFSDGTDVYVKNTTTDEFVPYTISGTTATGGTVVTYTGSGVGGGVYGVACDGTNVYTTDSLGPSIVINKYALAGGASTDSITRILTPNAYSNDSATGRGFSVFIQNSSALGIIYGYSTESNSAVKGSACKIQAITKF